MPTGVTRFMDQAQEMREQNWEGAPRRERPWPVTALAGLFFLQALGLAALGILLLFNEAFTWQVDLLNRHFSPSARSEAALFFLLGTALLPASLGFLQRWRIAWSYASFIQGLILFIALVLYFGTRPWYVYPLMGFSILLVIYLHQADVLQTFRFDGSERDLPSGDALEIPSWED